MLKSAIKSEETVIVHNIIDLIKNKSQSHNAYAFLNKYVFRLFLKLSTEGAHLIDEGKGFHKKGAACAKQRLPKPSKRYRGTVRRSLS